MPMPAGPRRAAPPRKKVSKNAPATPLPEPPAEEAEAGTIQPPSIINEPPAGADCTLTSGDSRIEIGQLAETVETTQHLGITADAEQPEPTSVHTEKSFQGPVEESEKQEAQEEHVEVADSRVEEEPMHTVADDQEVPLEQPPEVVEEEEEEEEARRHRVAARLAQMGAFNPLAGRPPIPSRQSLDEPAPEPSEAPLDVEDEVNVGTEEIGVTMPPPPVIPPRHGAGRSVKHDAVEADQDDDAKVDEEHRVLLHRDGES